MLAKHFVDNPTKNHPTIPGWRILAKYFVDNSTKNHPTIPGCRNLAKCFVDNPTKNHPSSRVADPCETFCGQPY